MNHSIKKRVAIYGRVSTEHEAQLSALENQRDWYEALALQHSEWTIVERYYDEGITGTAAQKRPAFMKMLSDAYQHKFDMVVTREVCRFARNTVDTLTVTRELTKIGIEVYFVQDNIRTMDNDGELRLTIMATLAQEESRKISERVRAGLAISRSKGTIIGSGNILGYDLVNGNYVINPEQAYVVKKIYELYAAGLGYKRICGELTVLGCKNASGGSYWGIENIGNILRNTTYKGYLCLNKSRSDGYLTQKRIPNSEEELVYQKGNFEPIVSEELWNKCAEIRHKRTSWLESKTGEKRKSPRQEARSVWVSKLQCSCGSSFRRFAWHQNADGTTTYGYECRRQKRQASPHYLRAHGLDAAINCRTKSVPFWQVDLLGRKIFQAVWKDRKESVLLACEMIESCFQEKVKESTSLKDGLEKKVQKLQKMQAGLRGMCALGDITREQFHKDNEAAQEKIDALMIQIKDLEQQESDEAVPVIDMDKIRATLNQWIDLSQPAIPDALINQFIRRVRFIDDNTYEVILNLDGITKDNGIIQAPSEVLRQQYLEQIVPNFSPADAIFADEITETQELFSFMITKEDAREQCQMIGMRFFGKKWHDKEIHVSV